MAVMYLDIYIYIILDVSTIWISPENINLFVVPQVQFSHIKNIPFHYHLS